ncbi:hypothetical protein ACFYVR_10220 [Rhodococcus sp. NPDC003318]|uniref:hypothetical protein n=1 Tax=Rhodococcus sp. NPDC003318 TaxID=3364503 RepID=UPI00369C2D71
MDGKLVLDEATVRSVAAALTDSAAELALLADRMDALVAVAGDRGRLVRAVRDWARWTTVDADALSLTAGRCAGLDAGTAAHLRTLDS